MAFDSTNDDLYVTHPSTREASNSISIVSGTRNMNVAIVQVGSDPEGIAYDSENENLYITHGNGSFTNVLSSSTDTIVASFPEQSGGGGITFDSANDDLYVANSGLNTVSVINGVTNAIQLNITLNDSIGYGPYRDLFDPSNGNIYVTNPGDSDSRVCGNVSVINGSTNTVIATVPAGLFPGDLTLDSVNGDIYVANTDSNNVTVIATSTNSVVASIPVGVSPEGLTFDPRNGDIYVENFDESSATGNVSVINGSRNVVTSSIYSIGYGEGRQAEYDPSNGYVYFTGSGTDSLFVVNGSDNSVLNPIPLDDELGGATYASVTGDVYVTNYALNSVYVISGSSNSVLGTIPVGSEPFASAFDPTNDELYVTNSGTDTVSIIAASNNTAIGTLQVGGYPMGAAYDPVNGDIYVANSQSSMSVISGRSNAVTATIPVVGDDVAFNPTDNDIYVTDRDFNRVSVISGTNNSFVANISEANYALGIAYDGASGDMYVGLYSDRGPGNVSVISSNNSVLTTIPLNGDPFGLAADVLNGDVYVSTTSTNISVIGGLTNTLIATIPTEYPESFDSMGVAFDTNNGNIYSTIYQPGAISIIVTGPAPPTYPVNFSESGLPNGTRWSAGLNGTTQSSTARTITFTEPNGTYVFVIGSVTDYAPNPSYGTFMVNGANVTWTISFTLAPYSVTFTELGLPSGTWWTVDLNGSLSSTSSSSIVFNSLVNNTTGYTFIVETVPGYTSNPASGAIAVNGANVTKTITFTALPAGEYSLTFIEFGLPTSTNWSVTIGSTTHSSTGSLVTFTETNGTYSFTVGKVSGYFSEDSSGNITVSGADQSLSIDFSPTKPPIFVVTFIESGLPTGTLWSVDLNGTSNSSTTATIGFTEKNGTYNFTVTAPTGYTASPSSGTFTVLGKAVSQSVTFSKAISKITYALAFSETGLPSGTLWSVTVNGTVESVTIPTVISQEVNGSYTFAVGTVNGYTASPSSGVIKVSGEAANQTITFSKTSQATGFLGLAGDDGYILIGVVVAVVAAVAAVILVRKRKVAEPAPPPTESPASPPGPPPTS